MDRLIKELRESDIGCHVAGDFLGAFIYADDLFLLNPSRPGLQAMVNICNKFAKKNGLKFSTNPDPKCSKTKCIVFSPKPSDREGLAEIQLDGVPLPWVPEVLHLGHILECDSSMKKDIAIKRGRFIGKVNSLKQEFHYVSPEIKMKMYDIYTKSFYGSNLYDLFSTECNRLYTSWNIAVRDCFQISRLTHRYLIEEVSQSMHPLVALSCRFINFNKSLKDSSKPSIRLLAKVKRNDRRTVHGNNLALIAKRSETNDLDNISSHIVKTNMKYSAIPENETWRLSLIKDMLSIRTGNESLEIFEQNDINDMLLIACTS